MKIAIISAIAGLFAAIVVPAFALEPKAYPSVSKCQALDRWVSQLEKLPAEYESFMALEVDERRAVYGRLASEERAALWHRQLGEALAQERWSEEQKALIAETRAFITAENIAGISSLGSRHEATKIASYLESRILQAFPRQEAMELFFVLGSPAASSGSGLSGLCSCRPDNPVPCHPEGQCIAGNCQVVACGLGWLGRCTGLCYVS